MSKALQSLIRSGTKLYLDSVAPAEVDKNIAWGAVGATSNPAIISSIVDAGSMDDAIESLLGEGLDDQAIAWELTDRLVSDAQEKFLPIHESTGGNAGWVSFELDPLLEDPTEELSNAEQAHFANRRLYAEAVAKTVPTSSGQCWYPQRETHLGGESPVLER
jgi:transaldolase